MGSYTDTKLYPDTYSRLGLTQWSVRPWTDGTTSDVPEGSQLYFTVDRANTCADARIAAQKGQAEGIMPLDSGGKAPLAHMPDALLGLSAQAADSAKFGGQLPTYYAQASHTHAFSSLTSKPTTLSGYGITDAATASHTHSGYETAIVNPSANGYLLSSTTAGVRSWVAPYSHPATHAQSVIDSSTGWITTALAGKQAAGSYLTTTGTAADSAKLGGVAAASFSQTSHTHEFSSLTSKPTTLSGYGITDAAAASHTHTLDSLSNTTITSVASGEVLRYNGTVWVNATLAEAGIQANTLSSQPNSGITAGTYNGLTVNAGGHVTEFSALGHIQNKTQKVSGYSYTSTPASLSGLLSYVHFDGGYASNCGNGICFSSDQGGGAGVFMERDEGYGTRVRIMTNPSSNFESKALSTAVLIDQDKSLKVSGAFGCNGAAPQTAYSVGAQVTGSTEGNGTLYGWSASTVPAAVLAQLAAIRTALINCGIAVT